MPSTPASASASSIARGQRPAALDPFHQLLDERVMLLECAGFEALAIQVPRDAVPGKLRGRHQAQAFVVGLIEPALAIQQVVGPLAPVSVDAREEDQVV